MVQKLKGFSIFLNFRFKYGILYLNTSTIAQEICTVILPLDIIDIRDYQYGCSILLTNVKKMLEFFEDLKYTRVYGDDII